MHMADALISPVVGASMLAITGSVLAHSVRKIQKEDLQDKLPLMSVAGAFVFAAQMINFSIPGTGASGHLGGGMLLAVLLGPYAGFLAMAAILLIQALFFADGGLLAYGCNVFNLGFYPCFITYPLIYKVIMRKGFSLKRLFGAVMFSSIIGLQLGSFSVTAETLLSGKTAIPFKTFLLAMQSIHLGIGIVEGMIVFSAISFVYKANPLLIDHASEKMPVFKMRKFLTICAACTFAVGSLFSLFASKNPDGLEWAISKVTGSSKLPTDGKWYQRTEQIQKHTAVLPDYSLKKDMKTQNTDETSTYTETAGTSLSGVVGALLTGGLIAIIGVGCYIAKRVRGNARKTE